MLLYLVLALNTVIFSNAQIPILNSCGQRLAEFRIEPLDLPFSDEDVHKILENIFGEDADDLSSHDVLLTMSNVTQEMNDVALQIAFLESQSSRNEAELKFLYGRHHDLGNILAALKRYHADVLQKPLEN